MFENDCSSYNSGPPLYGGQSGPLMRPAIRARKLTTPRVPLHAFQVSGEHADHGCRHDLAATVFVREYKSRC